MFLPLFFSLSLLVKCAATYPASINIGGLFNPVNSDGSVSIEQSEHLAAFIMAIKEVNDKSDGMWDDLLPSTQLRFAIGSGHDFEQAALSITTYSSSFSSAGVEAIVGALDNTETLAFDLMARDRKIPQVHSVASSTLLGQGEDYPFKSQTCALDSFQGMVYQSLLCGYFKTKKIVVVSTVDVPGARISQEVMDGVYCSMEVMANIHIQSKGTDFAEQIQEMKATGGRYFALFLAPVQVAALLEQAYNVGMFRENVVFFSTTPVTHDILNHFSPGADVAAIMEGYFGIEYWPKYAFGRRPEAISFAQRWSQQASTAGVVDPTTHSVICNSQTDDDGDYYLYRSQTDATVCTGIDFSTYPSDGSTIKSHTALTYEATIVLAKALDAVVKQGLDYTNGDVLQAAIMYNVSFEGVTGYVDVYEGMVAFDSYARGDREEGLNYKVLNFNAEEYKAGRPAMVHTGMWNSDTGTYFDCPADLNCFIPIFASSEIDTSVPPADTPPDILDDQSAAGRAILFFVGALSFIFVLVFGVFTFMYSKAKQVKASQPVMLYCILTGGLIASARVIIPAFDLSASVCGAVVWLGHLSFAFVFGGLFVKTWRVHKLVNSRTLKKVKFTAMKAFQMFVCMMALVVVYLIFLHVFSEPVLGFQSTTIANQTTNIPVCSLVHPNLQTAFFALEFAFLVYAFKICWAIKDVPDSVNESKLIAAAMSVIVVISCMVFPILFLISLTPNTSQIIAGLAFGFANIFSLSMLFVPKMVVVLSDPTALKNETAAGAVGANAKHGHNIGNGNASTAVTPQASNATATASATTGTTSGAVVSSVDALHGMTLGRRVQFCHAQLQQWQGLLMRLQEIDSDNRASSMSSMNESRSQSSRRSDFQHPDEDALAPFEGEAIVRVKFRDESNDSAAAMIVRSFKLMSSKLVRGSSTSKVNAIAMDEAAAEHKILGKDDDDDNDFGNGNSNHSAVDIFPARDNVSVPVAWGDNGNSDEMV